LKNLSKVSTPKKILFIGLGILVLGIVVLAVSLPQSLTFRCAYNLGRNNSSLTQDQIIEYCNNQNIETENVQYSVNVGTILLITGLIIIGTGGIWIIARRRKGRTEETSSSAGLSSEMMINNREDGKEENYQFTPKKVLAYCIIVGLISAPLSIFITSLILLSVAAFVFASITVWYMFAEKFHGWKERRSRNVFPRQ
jgi:preprotein translocase subunit Sec61beta